MSIVIDRRSIADVRASDLRGFTRAHFFAGIAGWELALNLARWPADREVWTGSCPCQPYSAAGKNKGDADERNLWPDFFRLIRECRPDTIFGEQVENAIGHGWLDGVFGDLEREGYTCGATVLGAHSVGAPHIRQRLFWVANSGSSPSRNDDAGECVEACSCEACQSERRITNQPGRHGGSLRLANAASLSGPEHEQEQGDGSRRQSGPNNSTERGGAGGLEHAAGDGRDERRAQSDGRSIAGGCGDDWLGDPSSTRPQERSGKRSIQCGAGLAFEGQALELRGPWSDSTVIYCRDEKYRRVGRGVFPLAYGIPRDVGSRFPELRELAKGARGNRVGRLKGYGNAINPWVAAEFIAAFLECEKEDSHG